MPQALNPAVSAAAAATELLGRVQASLTAGFSAGAAAWPAASAPVMQLPASTLGLLLAAPAAAKPLNPALPAFQSLEAPQLMATGTHLQNQLTGGNNESAAVMATAHRVSGAQAGTSAEPQQK